MIRKPFPILVSLLLTAFIAGCGGGGSSTGSDPGNTANSTNTGNTGGGSLQSAMTMACIDGPDYQCSGGSIVRVDNGVAVTDSGVQVYGRSTNETAPNRDSGAATGMMLASGGMAEIRVAKDANGIVTKPVLLLKNLGISWDGRTERPLIIETFSGTAGRVQLDAQGRPIRVALPDSSDLGFFDWVTKGINGTQANYANNIYFPRADPPRCPANVTLCVDYETRGFKYDPGNWRSGGVEPDYSSVQRFHSDGDLQAGDGVPGADGKGTPYPGFKGYRSFDNWGLRYANLGAWVTQDTVTIVEWAGRSDDEHNNNRRGMAAYGDVTKPADVPASGTATYSGIVYGWYAANNTQDPAFFRGAVSVTVDFATRQAVVSIQNTVTYNEALTPVPAALTATATMGATGQLTANYLTGPVDNGTLRGGLGGRYFGPVISTGAGGSGPAEIGGTFSLSNPSSGQAVVAGFIAQKR